MKEKLYTKWKLTDGELSIYAKVGEEIIHITTDKDEDKFKFKMSDKRLVKRIAKLIIEATEL